MIRARAELRIPIEIVVDTDTPIDPYQAAVELLARIADGNVPDLIATRQGTIWTPDGRIPVEIGPAPGTDAEWYTIAPEDQP